MVAPGLSVGEVARRTGLTQATLRAWETRHGFPRPERLPSGHRRYRETDVEAIQQVVSRRDMGSRLEAAIADVMEASTPKAPSTFAELRRRHPQLLVQRLHKSTLMALSWAIEDEFCAQADHGHIAAGFQRLDYFEAARPRWREISRIAGSATVFADVSPGRERPSNLDEGLALVPLTQDAPMRREWFLICLSARLPVVMAAWEPPGQDETEDRERVFECIWSLEQSAVRDAMGACAQVAALCDVPNVAQHLHWLADEYTSNSRNQGRQHANAVAALFARVVGYVDQVQG